MKLALLLAAAALTVLAACTETRDVANQFEKTTDELHNTANTIESATENNIRAAEDALDQDWQNKSIDVNVSIGNPAVAVIAPLAAASLLLAVQTAAPKVETAFLAALGAGDARAAQALLAEDATIMHEESGRPEPSTGAAIAAFLRGCEGAVQFEVSGDEPDAMAFNTAWSCGARGRTDMLLWTRNGRIVWVQLGKLVPAVQE